MPIIRRPRARRVRWNVDPIRRLFGDLDPMHFPPLIQSFFLSVLSLAAAASPQSAAPAATAPAASPSSEVRIGPKVIDAPSFLVGRLLPDVEFVDLDGKPGKLSDFRQSS